jgi:hypothetical protein
MSPVANIWLSAPSSSHGQNSADGHGTLSPVARMITTKKTIENGKPNRKRMLVAPQVPSGPVSERCMALRATCPSEAMIVKGIQSEAMVNMRQDGSASDGAEPDCVTPQGQAACAHACDAIATASDVAYQTKRTTPLPAWLRVRLENSPS